MSLVSEHFVDEIANACLSHLINEPELLGEFMAQTGTGPNELRSGLNENVTTGLLDFFAHNEPALLSVCANAQISTEQFMRAYYKLNPSG
ncbi:DUF3572 family protein [Maritalea porphyrae]|uniref:DUF3572 family protein n=1 Tax=Maritalea porphyrae TaxID=880732 RepID=A0ABQ5UU47_9HYPH|nr:DUF3572 family protein [Maritalea porphyrae]GLQ18627.1 hypothetical protein GCM10007879_28760 [Maritalea porphyrae]